MRRRPNPSRSGSPTWAPMPTPLSTAICPVLRTPAGPPPCQPQAMLAEVMTSISSVSLPRFQRPKLSPMSELRSRLFTSLISDSLQTQCVDQTLGRSCQIGRFVDGESLEADMVAPRHHLTQLPHRSVGHARRADESAQRRPIDTENDRLVTGDVDRADRVPVVEDVGGMTSRHAAGLARPLPAIGFQAIAHPVRVAVELPVVAEEV